MTTPPLTDLDPARFETTAILKAVAAAIQPLAELKGVSASIPNQGILINTLGMQEAKDSSAIENIVTTHDELFRDSLFLDDSGSAAAKEVLRYGQALRVGFEGVRRSGLLTNNQILEIQAVLEKNDAGFRRVAGTALRNQDGVVVYTPPPPETIVPMMTDLERVINDDAVLPLHPLVRMALIHHQFETIHPFYDGNGRTGRIINVLYLVKQHLLDVPVLYMSRQIIRTKTQYYRLLQDTRDHDAWEDWVLYMLAAVEQTAREGIATIEAIKTTLLFLKHRIREQHPRIYSQDLINNLFAHPYTKIAFIERDLGVSRITAAKYLDTLTASGVLQKQRVGRTNYYVNVALYDILNGERMQTPV